MKKLNKKGFTIVELVIVIAVIAILAAVLIPTFSGVVDKANKSAYLQDARAALTCVIAMNDQGKVVENTVFVCGSNQEYKVAYANSKLDEKNPANVDNTPATVIISASYVDMNATNTDAKAFKSSTESDEKVLNALGFKDSDSIAYGCEFISDGKVKITKTPSGGSKTDTGVTFALKVSSDFSKNVVVVVPDTDTNAYVES